MEKQQVLQLVKKAVHEVDDKADIILFGSRARGDFQKESDWDFLILTEKQDEWEVWRIIRRKLFYAELETDEIFSTIVHNKDEWQKLSLSPLYQFIKQDGVSI
ncbi:MAG: nucleotidyltransferase domain-containing protein [Bacteroidales bacterium]|nr:nucleotidyltransferase domain-containing protein [Bacteroidales bacterium]